VFVIGPDELAVAKRLYLALLIGHVGLAADEAQHLVQGGLGELAVAAAERIEVLIK